MAGETGAALNAGAEFARGLTSDERKEASYNALNKAYGPAAAYDPAAALQAQSYGQHMLTDPIAVQADQASLDGKRISNAGATETNAYNVLAHPKMLLKDDLDNTQTAQNTNFTAQDQPGKLAQQAATIRGTNAQTAASYASAGASNAETAQRKFTLHNEEGQNIRTGAMGILGSLSDVAVNGGDIGAAFDKQAPLLAKMYNIDPQHLATLRTNLVADPTGTINGFTDTIHAADQEANNARLAGKGGAGGTGAAALAKAQGQASDRVNAMKAIAERTSDVPELMDQASSLVSQMSSIPAIRKARAELPGTAEYNYGQIMHRVQANLALTDLQAMKANGLSMGKVSNMEMKLSGEAFANTDVGLDAGMIRSNLARVKSIYTKVNANMQDDIVRIGKSAGGTGSGSTHLQAPIAAPPGFKGVDGQSYTSKDGSVAIYKNGKFLPQ